MFFLKKQKHKQKTKQAREGKKEEEKRERKVEKPSSYHFLVPETALGLCL